MSESLYSHHLRNKKIIIFGRYPPPVGGISTHVSRVIDKLYKQQNQLLFFDTGYATRFTFFPLYLYQLFLFLYKAKKIDIIYYHTLYLKYAGIESLFIALCNRIITNAEYIVIDHNCRYLYKKGWFFKQGLSLLFKMVDTQIFIGNLTEKSYRENNIYRPKKWSVQSAFLPPDTGRELEIVEKYPTSLQLFLEDRHPLLLVSAFKLPVLFQSKDLYGIDQSLYVVHHLKKEYPDVGLVIAVGHYEDTLYQEQLKSMILAYEIEHHVFILSGQQQLWPLLKRVDLFLRPTLSDGDSISVREALYFDTPVVASDVCVRPEKTILYKTRDQEDLLRVTLIIFEKIKQEATL